MLLRCKYQFSSYMTATANLQTSTRAALAVASVDKPIAIRLGQQELDEVLQLARAEDRPAGNFARMVYLLGLAVYREQGFLTLQIDVAQPARSRSGEERTRITLRGKRIRGRPANRGRYRTHSS